MESRGMKDFVATKQECRLFAEYVKHFSTMEDAKRQFTETAKRLLEALGERISRKSWLRPRKGIRWKVDPKANPRTDEYPELQREIRLTYKKAYRKRINVGIWFGLTPLPDGDGDARFYTYLWIWPVRRSVEPMWEGFVRRARNRHGSEVILDNDYQGSVRALYYRQLKARDPQMILKEGVPALTRTCRDGLNLARRFSSKLQ